MGALNNPFFREFLAVMEIDVPHDLEMVFMILDEDGSGEVSFFFDRRE